VPVRRRSVVDVDLLGVGRSDIRAGCGDECLLVHPVGDALGPFVHGLAESPEMALRILGDPEVGQRDPARRPALELVERSPPRVEIHLGWRGRGEHEAAGCDPDAGRVTRVERPVLVEVGHVMGRMTGGREARKPDHLVIDDADIRFRDRCELPPERVEGVPVEPPRARLEPRRVDEMLGAHPRDVHLELGVLADEDARGAGVVEMDVREEQMTHVARVDPTCGERVSQPGEGARGAAVVERETFAGVDEVRADQAALSTVEHVERPIEHAGTLPMSSRRRLGRRCNDPFANRRGGLMPAPTLVVGAPCWIDLYSSNTAKATEFYGRIFGWEAQPPQEGFGGYFTFTKDGKHVAGCMGNDGEQGMPDTWTVHLMTDDADGVAAATTANGGQVHFEPMQVAENGRSTMIADPGGASVGAWEPGQMKGFEVTGEHGTPGWFELHTRRYDESIAFYRDVFSWDAHTMSDTPEFRYTTLGEGDDALAGIMDSSEHIAEGSPGHWLVYFRVDDVDATLEAVTQNGGSVEHPAEDTPYGRLAGATDSTGVRFKLMG